MTDDDPHTGAQAAARADRGGRRRIVTVMLMDDLDLHGFAQNGLAGVGNDRLPHAALR